MSIVSVSDLQNKLDKDLAWRKKEIADVKMLALRAGSDLHYLFRSGLVLLCAHWEGYLKRSLQLYLEHVIAQRLRIRDVVPVLVANFYYRDVKRAAAADYPGSEEHHIQLAKRILKGLDEICEHPAWDPTTDGNPGTDTMERMLRSVGLDHKLGMTPAEWSSMKVFIDEQILRDRHRIAHGEFHRIDQPAFIERADRLVQLLDNLTDTIIRAASARDYSIRKR